MFAMSDDNQNPSTEGKPRTRTLGQAIIVAAVGLAILLGIAWAFDWELNSGFWRGVAYFAFEIISHLGK